MIILRPPEKPIAVLKALAASGRSGIARKAQAEIRARLHAELARGKEAFVEATNRVVGLEG